eukprot:1389712-Alexandrium_andersonii.AAC.1
MSRHSVERAHRRQPPMIASDGVATCTLSRFGRRPHACRLEMSLCRRTEMAHPGQPRTVESTCAT